MTRRQWASGVAGAAALIAVLTVVSRVAGFGRTLVFTNTVGAGDTADTYTAANNVPNIVFEVVAGGALASLVVPMLAAGIAAGDAEAVRRTASALLGWTLLVLTPLAVVLVLLAHPLAEALLADSDPAEIDLAARLLQLFAPQVVLYGLSVVGTGVLQAHRRFAGPALAPLLSSVVVAGAYLTFAALDGSPTVQGLGRDAELVLGIGTTLGAVALAGCLLPPLLRLRLGLRLSLRFPVGVAPRVARLAVAGVLTLAGQQLVAVTAIRLASGGPDGTQTVYFAGMTLFLLPWAALAVPLATSAYPGLAERAAVGDEAGYRRGLAPVAVLVLAASAVAAAGLVVVSGPVSAVFLASGEYADQAVALQRTVVGFAPGLVGYALVALLTRALYARGLWRAPTVCVVGGWLVAVAVDVLLAAVLPAADRGLALALGHSTGVTVAGVGLLLAVRRAAGPGTLAGTGRPAAAALLAAVLAGAAGLLVVRWLGADPVPDGGVPTAVGTGVAGGVVALLVAAGVMMVTAPRQLVQATRALRLASGPATAGRSQAPQQEVIGD